MNYPLWSVGSRVIFQNYLGWVAGINIHGDDDKAIHSYWVAFNLCRNPSAYSYFCSSHGGIIVVPVSPLWTKQFKFRLCVERELKSAPKEYHL